MKNDALDLHAEVEAALNARVFEGDNYDLILRLNALLARCDGALRTAEKIPTIQVVAETRDAFTIGTKYLEKTWKDSKGNSWQLFYCDLCETFSIGCPHCNGSTCNSMQCDKCKDAQAEFEKTKSHVWNYLTKDEKKTYDKIHRLKRLIKDDLIAGYPELDWKRLHENGQCCLHDYFLFTELLQYREEGIGDYLHHGGSQKVVDEFRIDFLTLK